MGLFKNRGSKEGPKTIAHPQKVSTEEVSTEAKKISDTKNAFDTVMKSREARYIKDHKAHMQQWQQGYANKTTTVTVPPLQPNYQNIPNTAPGSVIGYNPSGGVPIDLYQQMYGQQPAQAAVIVIVKYDVENEIQFIAGVAASADEADKFIEAQTDTDRFDYDYEEHTINDVMKGIDEKT